MEEYIQWAVQGLVRLRPDIVVHRINGDPQPGELMAPGWARDKSRIIQGIIRELEDRDLWQGKLSGKADDRPYWFDRNGGLPGERG
jgi:hypothetical protein